MSIGARDSSVMTSISKPKLALILLGLSALAVALVYQPLPDGFPQPWKYRFLSFWAHLFSKFVSNRPTKTFAPLPLLSLSLGFCRWTSESIRPYSHLTLSLLRSGGKFPDPRSSTSLESMFADQRRRRECRCSLLGLWSTHCQRQRSNVWTGRIGFDAENAHDHSFSRRRLSARLPGDLRSSDVRLGQFNEGTGDFRRVSFACETSSLHTLSLAEGIVACQNITFLLLWTTAPPSPMNSFEMLRSIVSIPIELSLPVIQQAVI